MTDPRGYVRPGQKLAIAASQINWINEQMRRPHGPAAAPAKGYSAPYTWVYARNGTGGTIDRWGVAEITGVDITPTATDTDDATVQFQTMPVLTVGEIESSADKWCVAIEPIANGEIGRVAVDGAVQVRKADVDKLGGVVVLWENSTWAFVRNGGGGDGGLFVAEFSGDWAYDTYKSIGEPGETIEVMNRLVGVRVGPGGGTYNTGNVTYAKLGENYYAVAFNLTRLEGYPSGPASGLSHVLGLVDGLLQWVDTAVCPEPELPPE